MSVLRDRLAVFARLLEAEWYNGNLDEKAYERLNADLTGILATSPDGLDVERLARAMQEDARTLALVAEDYPVGDLDEYRPEATRLATEYDRLASEASR